jgi:predicted peroxiredoxin
MRGLTIVCTRADAMAPALTLAMAQAALGGRARLFAQGPAVTGLNAPLMAEAIALGVELLACQTGLAEAGLDLAALDTRIVAAGPVSVLQSLGEDRLVAL